MTDDSFKYKQCIFLIMVLGVSCLMFYYLSSANYAVFMPFTGLRSVSQVSYNRAYSKKQERNLSLNGNMVTRLHNTTSQRNEGISTFKQRKVNIMNVSNSVPKRYFLCNGPTGRLGNQLFDFASSLGIARTLNYTLVMPHTHPLLKYFKINLPVLEGKPENLRAITLQQWRNNWWGRNGTFLTFNLTLSGYYRVWNYFKHVTESVRESLQIKDEFLDKAKQFLQLHTPTNRTLIGIHIRRGDFLTKGQQAYGKAVASKKYITTAMAYFKKRYNDSLFVVVSDDKRWCKTNLAGKDVVVSQSNDAIVDLAIMTLCNHTIITSGTFGWWGGWLAGGEVVYWTGFPKPGSKNEKEILFKGEYYPPYWTGIESD